jgi:hypothetical protein
MNNTAKQAMGHLWGERTRPLHKAMVYALSLDVRATSKGRYLTVERVAPEPAMLAKDYALRHLFEETTVMMPEGLRCDLPVGSIESGTGEVGSPTDPTSCWFELRLRSVLEKATATLTFDMTGVVNFDGGLTTFRNPAAQELSGETFATSCHESSTGAYRWLERRQLFGVGRVTGNRATRDEWKMNFSFDFYAAL